MSPQAPPETAPPAAPRPIRAVRRPGDRIFAGLSVFAGALILTTLAFVAVFLLIEGYPALRPENQALIGEGGDRGEGPGFVTFVVPLLFGTVWAAVIAMVIATPIAVGIALYISHYAPRRLSQGLGYVVDLLAAVPSVVFGLWGIATLAPLLVPGFRWLEGRLGFIVFFEGPTAPSGRAMLTAGVVLAVMILPIMTAVCREVFRQTPRLHEEAALAMGATRWEMIRLAVLPYGRSGVISGAMLGLGRALGETLAVALVLSTDPTLISFNTISTQNPSTIAANIALRFPESTGVEVNALIASGLVLFILTFAVNYLARYIASRGFSGAAG